MGEVEIKISERYFNFEWGSYTAHFTI